MPFPLPPQEPLVDETGHVTNAWYRSLATLTPMVIKVNGGDTVGMPQTSAIVLVSQVPGRTAFSTTLLLPKVSLVQQTLLAIDVDGGAGGTPIDLQAPGNVLINGRPSVQINTAYGFMQILWNGSGWSIIGSG